MNGEVIVFESNEFGQIRTITMDGEVYFVGKDVAEKLGYADAFGALKKHVDDEDKQNCQNDSFDSPRGMTVINESGLYSLILSSKLESAKRFKRWVTSEVLPSIRKTGSYKVPDVLPSYMIENPAERARRWADEMEAKQGEIRALEASNAQHLQQIGELKPKADYTDKILQSKGVVPITAIAKDYGMSGQEMNRLLHSMKVIYKIGGQWLLYSKYHAKGYTHSETVSFYHADGRPDVKMNTKWTQKGRLFLYEMLKKKGILPVIEQDEKAG